jgi:hypothetical protein
LVVTLDLFVDARLIKPIVVPKVTIVIIQCVCFSLMIALGLCITICLISIGRINIIFGLARRSSSRST